MTSYKKFLTLANAAATAMLFGMWQQNPYAAGAMMSFLGFIFLVFGDE